MNTRVAALDSENGQRDTFRLERQLTERGYTCIAGVDEAGRGPLAGPVVAGCVVLAPGDEPSLYQDSKTLSAARREKLFAQLTSGAAMIGVGSVSAREIETYNILRASLLAMERAVADCIHTCRCRPDFLLVDGKFTTSLDIDQQALIKGESKSASIAAASIVAKVTRDRIMAQLHERYPQYNFRRNQGYPTREHRQAVATYGPCAEHRRTFKGVREYFVTEPGGAREQQRLW
ncbi:MAG: ribonuclease HII [Desulfobulbus propionicus]|nr:MAG: ribonuclease HII [Desulfobulbus propionicus]